MDQTPFTTPESQKRSELARYWSRHQHVIEAFIRTMVWDPDDREDVLQDTAEFIAGRFDEYDPERSFANWAVGIARYRVLEYRRRAMRDRQMLGSEAIDQVVAAFNEVEEEVLPRKQALEACLEKLPQKYRTLIGLRYNDNLKALAIADRVGLRANTVSAALYRARMALGKCIAARLGSGGKDHA